MQKYKVVASKSQKKYTLIISADSESQAKEKLHNDAYSILSIQKVIDDVIT
jgi:DNA-dependent RNA polymerase auxiliary subunit epsilon